MPRTVRLGLGKSKKPTTGHPKFTSSEYHAESAQAKGTRGAIRKRGHGNDEDKENESGQSKAKKPVPEMM